MQRRRSATAPSSRQACGNSRGQVIVAPQATISASGASRRTSAAAAFTPNSSLTPASCRRAPDSRRCCSSPRRPAMPRATASCRRLHRRRRTQSLHGRGPRRSRPPRAPRCPSRRPRRACAAARRRPPIDFVGATHARIVVATERAMLGDRRPAGVAGHAVANVGFPPLTRFQSQAGSVTSGRPRPIRSAAPRANMPSASAGSVMSPSAMSGTRGTACLRPCVSAT